MGVQLFALSLLVNHKALTYVWSALQDYWQLLGPNAIAATVGQGTVSPLDCAVHKEEN